MTKKQRRTFKAEFKLQVVQMIREQGLSVMEVCRDLKLGETAVRHWLTQADEEAAGRPGIGNPMHPNAWQHALYFHRTQFLPHWPSSVPFNLNQSNV
jgi:transposase-like protein